MTEPEYLESLLAPLRASFHARRRDRLGIAEQISNSVAMYVKAVDVSVTRELCKAHGLPAPAAGDPPAALAAELLRLVRLLPELRDQSATNSPPGPEILPESPETASDRPNARSSETRPDKRPRRPNAEVDITIPNSEGQRWPNLLKTIAKAPLVIVGGQPHLERLSMLPTTSIQQVEWIDTTRQGTHAIGNLERRIRDHRIGGILILEGLVQHRHTDPLISAARGVDLAHSFGGKGGRAALLQSLDELESRICHQTPKR